MTYSVAIAGLGRIGCGYDIERAADAPPVTHVGAVAADPRFALAGVADPDPARRDACIARWPDVAVFEDAAVMFAATHPDVACIATPGMARLPLVEAAIAAGARLVFCEKPLAGDAADGERICAMCDEAGVALAVNLSRRWEPGCARVAALISDGEIGVPRRAFGIYTHGIGNNGAHLIDLVRWWLGEIHDQSIGARRCDDAPDFMLVTDGGVPVDVFGLNGDDCDYFRLEVVGSDGRILLDEFGARLSLRKAQPFSDDPTLRVLGPEIGIDVDPDGTMAAAWDNIARFLDDGTALRCTGADGLAAARVCGRLEAAA